MIHFTKGYLMWKWISPEHILKTLPFFTYRFFRTYVQHRVRDSDQDASHPARGHGKESGNQLPPDKLGKVPWQCGSRLELLDPVPCSGPLLPLWEG